MLARHMPGGATSWRVWLNRRWGIKIGQDIWIGYDAISETSRPDLVTIRDRTTVQIRAAIIAHFREQIGVVIEEDATVGPGAVIMRNVTIGHGAIVTAGSVVTQWMPPKAVVQGKSRATDCHGRRSLRLDVSLKEFAKGFRPLGSRSSAQAPS